MTFKHADGPTCQRANGLSPTVQRSNAPTCERSNVLLFVDRWYWLALLAAAPVFLFPSPDRVWVWMLIPLGWLIAWWAGRGMLPRTPLNPSLLLLAVMVGISLCVTWSVPVSLPKISGMILGLGAYFAVARTGRLEHTSAHAWWIAFTVFACTGLGVALIGLLGANWGAKFHVLAPITAEIMRTARVKGLPGAVAGLNPNEVAGALLWVAPMMLTLALWLPGRSRPIRRRRGTGRWMLALLVTWVAAALVVGVLVLAQSRGAYLGLGLALTVMCLVALPLRGRLLILVAIALAGTTLIATVLQVGPDSFLAQLSNAGRGADPSQASVSWESRVEIWSRGLAALGDFPLTGLGMNAFRAQIHARYPSPLIRPTVDIAHAHNEFLQAGLDLGLPGLVAFVALYIGAFWMLRDIWRAAPNPLPPTLRRKGELVSPFLLREGGRGLGAAMRPLALGLGGGLLAHAVYGLTDAVALGAKPGILFWLLLGLIASLHTQAAGDHSGPSVRHD